MLPLISFETGRSTQIQSSGQLEKAAPANGSLVLSEYRNHGREANTRRRIRKNLHPRSSEARRESFCPLDKDLSWKSDYRTCSFQYLRCCLLQMGARPKRLSNSSQLFYELIDTSSLNWDAERD